MRIAEPSESRLSWLFLLYAVPAVVFLSIVMAPFQVPDELNHALRADQISLGKLVPEPVEGRVHVPLAEFGKLYQSMWFHPEVKQTVELARQAGGIRWSESIRAENFQNTVQYGPVLYLPQVVGLWLGRAVELSAAQTLVAARILNGLAACLAGFFALRICRRGRALMFATLLLPMTLSQLASVSQDPLIIGLSHVVIAMASRLLTEGRIGGTGEFSLYAAIVAATTMARPSHIAMSLLAPAFVGRRDPGWRTKAIVGLSAAAAIGIWMYLLRTLMPPPAPEWSPSAQFQYLLTHPLALPTVMVNTFAMQGRWLLGMVVGHLGWIDTPMPDRFVSVAFIVLAFATVAPGNRGSLSKPALLAAATVLALVTLTCFALYLTWTPVRQATVDGLQGRYFLTVLPLAAWLVPAYGPRLRRALALSWLPVLAFPVVTLCLLPGVIMQRYYGSWPVMAESLEVLLLP